MLKIDGVSIYLYFIELMKDETLYECYKFHTSCDSVLCVSVCLCEWAPLAILLLLSLCIVSTWGGLNKSNQTISGVNLSHGCKRVRLFLPKIETRLIFTFFKCVCDTHAKTAPKEQTKQTMFDQLNFVRRKIWIRISIASLCLLVSFKLSKMKSSIFLTTKHVRKSMRLIYRNAHMPIYIIFCQKNWTAKRWISWMAWMERIYWCVNENLRNKPCVATTRLSFSQCYPGRFLPPAFLFEICRKPIFCAEICNRVESTLLNNWLQLCICLIFFIQKMVRPIKPKT